LGEETSKSSLQNNQKAKEPGERVRTRIRNAKPSKVLARSAPPGKKSYNQGTEEIHSKIPLPSKIIESRRIPVVSENTTVTPSPKLTQFHSFENSSMTKMTDHKRRVYNDPSQQNPGDERIQNRPPARHSSNEGPQQKSSIKRKLESTYMKNQQQKSQQRAFVRHSDNPFKNYKHDPNDSESYLDRLTSQGKMEATSSIIPKEGIHALRSTNAVPMIPGHHWIRDKYAADHRGTVRERGFHENHTLRIPDLLSQKANESNFQNVTAKVRPFYVHNPPGYPYSQHPYPQSMPLPDHFRQQSAAYLSPGYNNQYQVGGSLNTPHNLYPNTYHQNHFNVGIQPRDVHSIYAARQNYEIPYESQPHSNEYAPAISLDRLVSGCARGLNSSQFAPYQSNTFTSNWNNGPITKRDIKDKDIEAAFF
jgi:hypothetical protein